KKALTPFLLTRSLTGSAGTPDPNFRETHRPRPLRDTPKKRILEGMPLEETRESVMIMLIEEKRSVEDLKAKLQDLRDRL
ncbi:MAG: hypothetical protein ACE5O2_17765, partial [Armatimonadota bacterium]